MKQRKELQEEDFYNYWLKKYHNTTIRERIEKEPELCKTVKWYEKYAVTEEQHNEWYEWAIQTIMKHKHCSRMLAKRGFCYVYLNVAPAIKKPAKDKK